MRQPVRLGMRGDGRVEVLEGVAPGDQLIPATNGVVKAGQGGQRRRANARRDGAR